MPLEQTQQDEYTFVDDVLIAEARASFWEYQRFVSADYRTDLVLESSASFIPMDLSVASNDLVALLEFEGPATPDPDMIADRAMAEDIVAAVGDAGGAVIVGDGEIVGTDGGDLLFGGGASVDMDALADVMGLDGI